MDQVLALWLRLGSHGLKIQQMVTRKELQPHSNPRTGIFFDVTRVVGEGEGEGEGGR